MNAAIEFDESVLGRVRKMGGPTLVRRLLTLVLEQTPGRIGAILAGAESGDLPSVAFAAHALRSSAGNVGAVRVLDLATRLEAAAKAGDGPAVTPLAAELGPAYQSLHRRLAGILEEAA